MPGNTNCDVESEENHEDKETVSDTEAEYQRDNRDDVELLPEPLIR